MRRRLRIPRIIVGLIIAAGLGALAVAMWSPMVRELTSVEPGAEALSADTLDIVCLREGGALAGRVESITHARLTLRDARDASRLFSGAAEGKGESDVSFDISEVAEVILNGRYSSDMPLTPRVYLTDGGVLPGTPEGLAEGMLKVRLRGPVRAAATDGNSLAVRLRDVTGISYAAWANPFLEETERDILTLRDGSGISGELREIDEARIGIETAEGGAPERVACSKALTLTLRRQAREPEAELLCTVILTDGGRLKGAPVSLDEESLLLLSPLLGELLIERRSIERIAFSEWEARDEFPVLLDEDGQTVTAVVSYDGIKRLPPCARLSAEPGNNASPTPAGTMLVADESGKAVYEIDRSGKVVWEYPGAEKPTGERLEKPTYAERLPNGNTLICDYGRDRVIEVSREGRTLWSAQASGAMSCLRLKCGRTLVAENLRGRVLEMDANDEAAWKVEDLENVVDARRQRDGNTVALYGAKELCLRKIAADGETLWETKDFLYPAHILACEEDRILVCETSRRRLTILDNTGARKRVVNLRLTD